MVQTAAEQYILELVNRARLDPEAEAARQGIDLNEGLAPGRLTEESRQVLAHDAELATAAARHSRWMIAKDIFSHTGTGNSSAGERIEAAGYDWSTYGENLALAGSIGTVVLGDEARKHHDGLFMSPGHRKNILNGDFRELGIGQEPGRYSQDGTTYNAAMLTENFATDRGGDVFLTGVAYRDTDEDGFYSIGEGRGDIWFSIAGEGATQTRASGGYDLAMAPGRAQVKIARGGETLARLEADLSERNGKLDLIEDNAGLMLQSSASLKLESGLARAELLGLDDLTLEGIHGAGELTGNPGDNRLKGRSGADTLDGGAGDDRLIGNRGHDRLAGGAGEDILRGGHKRDHLLGGNGDDTLKGGGWRDHLEGGAGDDRLVGQRGPDRLDGGTSDDILRGGSGADTFVFKAGRDVIRDFEAGVDRLEIEAGERDMNDLADLAQSRGERLVLDLGEDTLVLRNVSDFASVSSDIDLV